MYVCACAYIIYIVAERTFVTCLSNVINIDTAEKNTEKFTTPDDCIELYNTFVLYCALQLPTLTFQLTTEKNYNFTSHDYIHAM